MNLRTKMLRLDQRMRRALRSRDEIISHVLYNRVRRALGEAQSVTEAATRFGFWHFGHFATEYRALFGELPSETFRRRRGVASIPPVQVSASARPPGGWLN